MTREELIEKGAELIERKLGYTNGWSIPSEDYEKLCKEAFIASIDLIEADYEARVLEAVEKLNLLIPDINDVVEAIKALRGER